jgi:hypothetical protein
LNAAYTNADGTLGADFGLQTRPPTGNPNYVSANTIQYLTSVFTTGVGWAKLFDKVITLKGGYNVTNSSFSFGRDSYRIGRAGTDAEELEDDTGNIGIMVSVTPFNGFTFGGGFYPDTRTRDATYEGGITYTIPRTVIMTATFSRDTRDSSGTRGGSVDGKTTATVGVRAAGIPNLNWAVAAKLDKLHDFTGSGTVLFVDYINYTIGKLRIGFDTNQQILLAGKATTGAGSFDGEPFSFLVQPYISYAFSKLSPRLDLAYIYNGTVYGATLWTNDIGSLTNIKGDWAFVVQPSVGIRILSGLVMNAGLKFSYSQSEQIPANNRMLTMPYLEIAYRFSTGGGGGGNPNYPGGGGNPNYPGGGGNPNYR